MDAMEAIYLLRRLGLSLTVNDGRLGVSPAELLDDDSTWLIRKHRDAIIAELLDDSPAWAWIVCFGTHTLETYHDPYKTHAEMVTAYQGAVRIAPLPESMWPHDPSKGEKNDY